MSSLNMLKLHDSQLNLLEEHHHDKLNILLDSKHAGPLASYIII